MGFNNILKCKLGTREKGPVIMTITSNQELYAAVRNTCGKLESERLSAEAVKLKDALKISSLPGEILGELRLVLTETKRTEPISIELSRDINCEIDYINSVLR
jgi:head-tail adaptor